MSDNYAEETKPLFKMLRTEAFRFVLVHFNHYSLLRQLKEDLQSRFPERPFFETDGKQVSYRELVDKYYKLGKGFFLVNNFEGVLNDPDKYIGLNLRRDKLAKFPIAFICFISPGAQELVEKDIMEKMPDLWSFRSFILNLEANVPVSEKSSISRNKSHKTMEEISSLGGYGNADKSLELQRLQNLVAETPVEEGALLETLYEQMKDIQMDLGLYSEALDTINRLKSFTERKENLANLYLEEGDLYATIGQYTAALNTFNIAMSLSLEYSESNKNKLGIINERIGSLYQEMGNIEDALQYFTRYNEIEKELAEAYPENEKYKSNLAVSYAKLGQLHASLGNLDKALSYYQESNRLEKELYEGTPENISFKNGLAISYQFIAHANFSLGDLRRALVSYEKFNHLEKELYAANPENVSFKNALAISYQFLGNTELSLGNLHNALDNYEKYNQLEKELYEDYPENISFKNGWAIS
ncbi:MAG: hypothetical protein M3040_09025, partial [Bacteroidota bacterium]|nr:hypothetical protein [Bacteroidota bacterium]